jgi:hypothetical protein
MKKKDRSPSKPQASPNPRPKRRNKKQRESMPLSKKKDSPAGTPPQTPIQTPERRIHGNMYDLLQNDSDGEDASPATINAEDQVEIESVPSDPDSVATPNSTDRQSSTSNEPAPVSTPEDLKRRPTNSGPLVEIPPTNAERLGQSSPLFASQLPKTTGNLFPELSQPSAPKKNSPTLQTTELKPPPVASLSVFSSTTEEKQLAIEVFGDDAKLPARRSQASKKPPPEQTSLSQSSPRSPADSIHGVNDSKLPARGNPYNSAGRLVRSSTYGPSLYHVSLIEEQRRDEAQQAQRLVQTRMQPKDSNRTTGSEETNVDPTVTAKDPMSHSSVPEGVIDAVDRLDRQIAAKQEQLMKLQQSIAALTQSEPPAEMDADMTDDSFTLVQYKQPSPARLKQAPIQPSANQPSSRTVVPTAGALSLTADPNHSETRDPLTELAQRRPIYPRLPEPTPKRPFFQRVTWRIEIPKITESPEKSLIDGITEIWSILKEADDKLLIYPWKARNFGKYKALSGPSKLPSTKEGINRYFPDAYFRPHPGSMWLRVYIGSTISDEELGSRTHYFFGTQKNKKRVGFWKNGIQFEETVEIGWLYRSTPGMSAQSIQKELFAHTGIHTSLRWRLVNIPQLKGEIPENLQVRALHITVRKEDGNLAKAKFTKLVFARHRRSHFIGGSPMRLIPISRDLSPHNQDKCLHFAGRQLTFLKNTVVCESFDILQIDNKAVGLQGRTLRELILEIPLRDSGRQAFLSVDRTFNGSSVKLVCYEKHTSECRNRLATLLPYLIFTNPNLEKGIRGCFSADANERSLGVKWDDKRKEVVTVDDEILEGFEDWDSDDDTDQSQDGNNQFMIDVAAATGLSFNKKSKKKVKSTKVQEVDAGSIFSQSTIRSINDGESEEDSDDTPKTINRSTPTAQTEAISSLSEGPSNEIKNYLDQMTKALMQLTTMIPNTPENQAALANIRAILPTSQRAGSSSDSQGLGSSGSGALLR